jgi:hypothetical protein
MKKLVIILFFGPFVSRAQNQQPRFENDTLYTSSGYKIFKGQLLHLSNGGSAAGYFNYIKFPTGSIRTDTYILQNSSILVNKLRSYKYTGPDNASIRIVGMATLKDGAKMEVDLLLNFERAIESYDGLPSELIVPAEYKPKPAQITVQPTEKPKKTEATVKQTVPEDIRKLMVADEIKKLFDLYKAGALTKEEYEAQKKKLLERQ